jgi:hypothetical protein
MNKWRRLLIPLNALEYLIMVGKQFNQNQLQLQLMKKKLKVKEMGEVIKN